MQSLDRRLSLGLGVHLDESEPFAPSGVAVLDDLRTLHRSELGEPPLEVG